MDTKKGHKYCSKKKKKSNLPYNLMTSSQYYSLAAFICIFMFPYLTNHFVLTSFPYVLASFCNPKCLFVVVNVIVIFLVGESRAGTGGTTAAAPANEIYEEYVKRGRRMRRSSAGIKKLLPADHQEKRAEATCDQRLVLMIKGGVEEEKEEELMEVKMVDDDKGEEKQKEEEEEGKKKVVDDENEEDELEKQKDQQKEEEGEGNKKAVDEKEEEEEKEEESKEIVVENKGEVNKEKQEDEEESEELMMPREELNMRIEAFLARVNKKRQIESGLMVSIRSPV